MANIMDVARWFVNKKPMSHKKLQKLCYYSQAWSYALYDRPLFTGEFEAWVHGPINKKLWKKFKEYSYEDIPLEKFKNIPNKLSKEVQTFLERVWVTYGDFSGYQLELLSHSELPWIEARKGVSPVAPSNNIINPKSMQKYYYGLINSSGEGIGE